jgi:tetratricopeptide (TPR) repeat protein
MKAPGGENGPAEAGQRGHLIWFWLIMLLALGLRLYNLHEEPVFLDAYTSVVHLEPPDAWQESPYYERWRMSVNHEARDGLLEYLKANRRFDPATMPMYYSLEYLWSRWVGRTIPVIRLLSVLLGMMILPVIYLFGRSLWGRHAGLVAMALTALSPVYCYYSREIRMYILLGLLALLSSYTFMQLWRDRRLRWWFLHGGCAFLLLWTHPFATLLPFAQGLFLLFFYWREFGRIVKWGFLQIFVAIPPLIYIASIRFWGKDQTSFLMIPELRIFLGDLLADDAVNLTYQFVAMPAAWLHFVSEKTAQSIVRIANEAGYVLIALIIVSTGWLGLALTWKAFRRKEKAESGEAAAHDSGKWYCYLLLWWLVPPLVLYAASVFWRPCIHPRYTVHCALALYLLLGGAAAMLPGRWTRRLAAAVLVGFFAFEQMYVFGSIQGPDWKSAAEYIHENAKEDDLIIHHDWFYTRAFIYNLGPTPQAVSFGRTYANMAEQAAFYLGLNKPSRGPEGGIAEAWVVARTWGYKTAFASVMEEELAKRNLVFTKDTYMDRDMVHVYHVRRNPDGTPPIENAFPLHEDAPKEFTDLWVEFWRIPDYYLCVETAEKSLEIDPDWARGYSCLGMTLRELGRTDEALAAFQKAVEIAPSDYLWTHISIGMILTEKGRYDEAIASIQRGLDEDPAYAWAWTCLGKAYAKKGMYEKAVEAFERSIALDPNDLRSTTALEEVRQTMRDAPEETLSETAPDTLKDPGAASQTPEGPVSADLIRKGFAALEMDEVEEAAAAFRQVIERDADIADAHAGLGLAHWAEGRHDAAYTEISRAFELDRALREPYGPLVDAALNAKDAAAVRKEMRKLRKKKLQLPRPVRRRLKQDYPDSD